MPVEQIIASAGEASFVDVLSTFLELLDFPAVTLLCAMLLEIIVPINASFRLSSLCPIFAGMARKVNKAENSASQTAFSSIMLPLLVIIIALFIVWFLRFVINYDAIVSLLILPFLLESKPILKTALKVRNSLESDNKASAKAELQKQMLRECSKLSAMGINKSTSEAVCMHMFANWFSVLVWFMLLGIEGAVIMQLIAVMNRSFSHKMNKTRQFGGFVYRLEQVMFIPATLAFMLTMFISLNISRILANLKKHRTTFVNFTSCVIMDTLGTYAGATLGGPRYYEGVMMRMPSLGDTKDPDSKTPLKIYNKIRFSGIMFVCICVIIKVVMYTGMQS